MESMDFPQIKHIKEVIAKNRKKNKSLYVLVHTAPNGYVHIQGIRSWNETIFFSRREAEGACVTAKEELKESYQPEVWEAMIGVVRVYKLLPTDIEA